MSTHQFAARVSSSIRQSLKIALALCVVAIFSAGARGDDLLFDWKAEDSPTPVSGYIPAPMVNNSTDPTALGTRLAPVPVGYKSIKTQTVLNGSQISSIFGNANYKINYAFYDLEGASAAQFTGQVTAINAVAGTPKPYVGNFDLYPAISDGTRAPGYTGGNYTAYINSGATMANEALYPGSPTFRTKTGVGATEQSTAPNIRSALFALPISRMTMVEASLPANNKHIPYVNRFNNFGNALLNDAPADPQYPFKWSNPTGDQMLSRGDFKAMVAHYRLRGADGVHLLDGGVVGYSQTQFEQDAKDGWNISQINSIYAGGGAKVASLDTTVRVDGVTKSLENAGVVFSGVYSLTQNSGKGKLAVLVSNLDGVDHTLAFLNKIGSKTVPGGYLVPAGKHSLLEFTGAGTQWQFVTSQLIFSAGSDADRSGVGVPEPVAMGTLSVFACMMLFRRSRRK